MKISIRSDTRISTQRSLCDSCTSSTIICGKSQNDRIVRCNQIESTIKFNVEECSGYTMFEVMSLDEMKEMATVIELKLHGVGFYTAEQWRNKHHGKSILPPEYDD